LRGAAQASRVKRAGVLTTLPRNHPDAVRFWAIGADELRRLGWEEGRNLAYDVRPSVGDPAKLQTDEEPMSALGRRATYTVDFRAALVEGNLVGPVGATLSWTFAGARHGAER